MNYSEFIQYLFLHIKTSISIEKKKALYKDEAQSLLWFLLQSSRHHDGRPC